MAKTVGREPAGGSDGHHSCELTTEDTERHRGNPEPQRSRRITKGMLAFTYFVALRVLCGEFFAILCVSVSSVVSFQLIRSGGLRREGCERPTTMDRWLRSRKRPGPRPRPARHPQGAGRRARS